MTYSQRSTHFAAASDYTYLEYQIGLAADELKQALLAKESWEADWIRLTSSPAYDPATDVQEEKNLREEVARQEARVEAIRKLIAGLEDELAKLED